MQGSLSYQPHATYIAEELARAKGELQAQINQLANHQCVSEQPTSQQPADPAVLSTVLHNSLNEQEMRPSNLMSWVQHTTNKIDDMDRRFNMLDTAQRAAEQLHNLKQQDVGAIVNAIDDMRYSDLKSSVQNDKDKIAQLTADFKLISRDLDMNKTKMQSLEAQVAKAVTLESETIMSQELRSQQDVLVQKKLQKQLSILEQNMNARFEQLEAVVRENNSRCLLVEEEVQIMKESMHHNKAQQAKELSNASQIRIVNEELLHLRERINSLLGSSNGRYIAKR